MLLTFSKTNNNAEAITEMLKNTIQKVNESQLFAMLNDKEMSMLLKASLQHVNNTTENTDVMTRTLKSMITDTKKGKGIAGLLMEDTAFANQVRTSLYHMNSASYHADHVSEQLDQLVTNLNKNINSSQSPIGVMLRDSLMAKNLKATMENVRNGTDGFNQNMNALKENFFFKGYFNRQAKKKKAEEAKMVKAAAGSQK